MKNIQYPYASWNYRQNDIEIVSFFPQDAYCQEQKQQMLTSMWRVNILCIL